MDMKIIKHRGTLGIMPIPDTNLRMKNTYDLSVPPRVDRPQSEQLQADAKRRITGLRESQRDMLERRIATLAVVAAVIVLALAFLL